MITISFKADTNLKETISTLARKKGINTSAYIKFLLTKGINSELAALTENGLTVEEEMRILHSHLHDEVLGPFTTLNSIKRALKK